MQLQKLRAAYKSAILDIAAKYHAGDVRVFGSVSRGEATEQSDVDLLVHLDPEADLMDLAALHRELSELLNLKVDVVPDDSISPYIKDDILADAQDL